MCRRPKYFPICGECDNEETFVSKTCVSDRINPPCVLGHQSDPLDIAHDQAEDNNLLNGESITAEHIDLSIQHVNLDQAVETDIIHSESYYIDRVTDPLNQTCNFFQQAETVLLDCQIEMNTNQSIQTVNVAHKYAQTDIIDSDSYLIDKVSNPLNQFCNFVQQAETFLLDCQIEMNTNQSIQPVNLAHQYGQMDIIDSIPHSFNETNNFVQEVETVVLECDSKQVEMNKNQSFQPVNLVHECDQMAIIDSESNQSIFENQSESEMQESMLYSVHCDTVAYKARQSLDAVTPIADKRHETIDIIPQINCQKSGMDHSLTQPSIKRFLVPKENLAIKKQKKEKLKIYNTNLKQAAKDNLCCNGFKWKKNSCSFDSLMNIFIQFYFEVGRNSAQNESYLETLGCLGLVLRDNCNDESAFNPADIRETLFALLHDKGK